MFNDDDLQAWLAQPEPEPETNTVAQQVATQHHDVYAAYLEAGFDEEQAFELVLTLVKGILK